MNAADWFQLCPPCQNVRHDDCVGAYLWCECLAELLIEAEETP